MFLPPGWSRDRGRYAAHTRGPGVRARSRFESEVLQRALVVGPAMLDLDPDLQEHLAAEQLFHVAPCVGADQLQLLPAFAYDHRLVAGFVDDDGHVDAAQ